MSKHDAVNRPKHYTSHPSGIECIQITEHMGFNLGNAVKYIWRADLKADALEDLRKAAWYIARELARRENVPAPSESEPEPAPSESEPEPAPANDGWIEWKGINRRATLDAQIEYRTRNGFKGTRKAWQLDWKIRDFDSDIVAYRVVPADSAKSDE